MAEREVRVIAVLGSGPGLGAAIARRFAREGFAVALMARREEALRPIQAEIEGAGGRAIALAADATDPRSVHAAFARIREALGPADVLVYNAGLYEEAEVL
ncbi:MAG TPA: SDR family NAD(P)-dependent oxidoreductase, partial [Planctomycetota bacterium]|nr:SDR family NAD(P)-dependent oxidoreductase [Planctomycetota bacterium]